MPDKALDPVEWELVRADIAMEKALLKANGDWSKWEEFQTRTNARLERALIGWRAQRGRGLPMTEDERIALWWVVRTPELPWLMAPPRRPRRPGWPLRRAQRPRATALQPALGPPSPNGAGPSVAARMRASLEGELGAKMPRVLDRPEPATKSPGSSFTLPERSRVVPTILLSQQGTGERQRAWLGLWPAIGEPLNSEPMIGNAGR
jgi:hypothetical protein